MFVSIGVTKAFFSLLRTALPSAILVDTRIAMELKGGYGPAMHDALASPLCGVWGLCLPVPCSLLCYIASERTALVGG